MGVVVFEAEVFVAEVEDRFDGGVNAEVRQRAGLAVELQAGLVEVVVVEMGVAEGMDEFAGGEVRDLGDH